MASKIQELEPHLINQIAAGEVIERPASVVKELVENALDAKATTIEVRWSHAGQSLLSVSDDGEGMTKEDLLLCVKRHTTSKLNSKNLFDITTFGFRGEALAAVTSIARVTFITRSQEEAHGWKLIIEGNHVKSLEPTSHTKGTCIEVRDIFFSIPARLKFMKSLATEQKHIFNLLETFILIHPEIEWTLWQEKKLREYPKILNISTDMFSQRERLQQIFGKDFTENACFVEEEKEDHCLKGWISTPHFYRNSAEGFFFFVNKRPIKDRVLSAIVRNAYRDILPKDRYPCVVFSLLIPPKYLDINVHPAKAEVKFRELDLVRNLILTAIKKSLYGQTRVPELVAKNTTVPMYENTLKPTSSPHSTLRSTHFALSSHARHYLHPTNNQETKTLSPKENSLPFFSPEICENSPENSLGNAIFQLENAYIIAKNEKGIVIVDPHAGHERILYEKLKKEWEKNLGEIQFLLTPFPFELSLSENEWLEENQISLKQVGICCEKIEGFKWKLTGIPQIFKDIDPDDLIKELRQFPKKEEQTIEDFLWLRNTLLQSWACKKSIRFGDTLTLDEMNALLQELEQTPNSMTCNHGRPVYLTLSFEEISKLFKR